MTSRQQNLPTAAHRGTRPGLTGRATTRVLLVEHDMVFARLLEAWLEERGWLIRHYSSGRKAIAWVESNPVEVVITALETDDIDGFAVIEQLGRSCAGVPIIVCAPHAGLRAWDPSVLLTLGISAALARPIRFHRLEETIRGVLAAQSRQRNEPESSTFRLDPQP